jgi:hypothetical protein
MDFVEAISIVSIELLHMLRKGQLAEGVEKALTPAEPFYALAS